MSGDWQGLDLFQEDTAHEPLKYGDYIYLNALKQDSPNLDGYLWAEGQVFKRVGLQLPPSNLLGGSSIPPNFGQCIFRVCPQLQYENMAAMRGLKRQSSVTETELKNVAARMETETLKNKALLLRLDTEEPTPVLYGDKVQLMHVKSNAFLSGQRAMADMNRQDLLLTLEDAGSNFSLFKISPRYQFRTDGDMVFYKDSILLESTEIQGHTIGASNLAYNPHENPSLVEASLSESASGWTICKYCRVLQDEHDGPIPKYLLFGQPNMTFRLWHPEAKSFIAAPSHVDKPYPYLRRAPGTDALDPAGWTAKGIWYFECANKTIGGAITWDKIVRLRHAVTGQYLAVVPVPVIIGDATEDAPWFDVVTVKDPTPDTLFQCHTIVQQKDRDKGRILLEDCSVRLRHKFPFALRAPDGRTNIEDCWLHFSGIAKRDPAKGPRPVVPKMMAPSWKLVCSTKCYPEDPMDLVFVPPAEVRNLFKLQSCIPVLRRFVALLQRGDVLSSMQFRNTESALSSMVYMMTEVGADDVGLDVMEVDGAANMVCQEIAREIKLLDELMPCLQQPVLNGDHLGKMPPEQKRIHALVYKAIAQIVQNNRRTEIYFARHKCLTRTKMGTETSIEWINACIAQVGDVEAAADTITMILSNNEELLELYVDENTINKFIELIGDQGPQRRFMRFFTALCSCNGKQIITNQELCLTRIFSNAPRRKALMLELCTIPDVLAPEHKQKWKSLSDAETRAAGGTPDHGVFLGKEEWTNGFDPVFLSWSCHDQWKMGMDQLFHSPRALQIDHLDIRGDMWCPVDKVLWVIDPIALYDNVFGAEDPSLLAGHWWHTNCDRLRETGAPDLEDKEAVAIFESQKQLALYFEAEIDLYTEMCLDRSYNNIHAMEEHFEYVTLVSLMVNDKLPDQIRASFTLLLMRVWVDRYPHGELMAPNPIQVFDAISIVPVDDADALPQYRVDPASTLAKDPSEFFHFGKDGSGSNKFHLVEDFISDYLIALGGCQIAKEKEKNIFTLAVLQILSKLVAFGFYGSRAEIIDLCNPMISTLDGRADKMQKEGAAGDEKRRELDDSTVLVMDSKRAMIDSLCSICKLRDDYRLRLIMNTFKESVQAKKPLTEQAKGEAWMLNDVFQGAFNDAFEAGGETDGTALDLDAISAAPLATICMDLMMYQQPEIFEASLSLLKFNFTQRETIIKAMEKVQLLITEDIPLYGTVTQLIDEVGEVKNRIESYETWGVANEFSGIDDKAVEQVISGLSKMAEFVFEEGKTKLPDEMDQGADAPPVPATPGKDGQAASSAGPSGKPTTEWQDLLRNLGVCNIILRGVEIPYHKHEPTGKETTREEKENKEKTYATLETVVRACWSTARRLIASNKDNQNIFYPYTSLMISEMQANPRLGITFILIEVFRDNYKTIENAPMELFYTFAELMMQYKDDDNALLKYLGFYEVMIETRKLGIVRASQRKIIDALCDPRMLRIAEIFTVKDPGADAPPSRQQYHKRLLTLFEKCCRSKNTGAQAILQKQIPALDLMDSCISSRLSAHNDEFAYRTVLVRLVNSVHFDTPLVDFSMRPTKTMWNFLNVLMNDVDHAAREDARGDTDPEHHEYAHEAAVPCFRSFLENVYGDVKVELVEECATKRGMIVNTAFNLASDHMLDMELRKFAYQAVHRLERERVEKFSPTDLEVLAKDATTLALSRKKSSWSMMLSGQGGALTQKPSLYYKLFAEVAQTDRGLIEDSEGLTESDHLVAVLNNVEALTDPNDPAYLALPAAGREADARAQKIELEDLTKRMIDHVAVNLSKDIDSGYDTIDVNKTCLDTIRKMVEYEIPKEGLKDEEFEAQKVKYIDKQDEMAGYAAIELCVDVISAPVPLMLVESALECGISLLQGGNAMVQKKLAKKLTFKPSDPFYLASREYLRTRIHSITHEREMRKKGTLVEEDGSQGFTIKLVEFLRLWAEGHNLQMQDLLRMQEDNKKEINLVDTVCLVAQTLACDSSALRGMEEDYLVEFNGHLEFFTEVLQGPCPGNQEYLATKTALPEVLKRTLISKIHKPGQNSSVTVAKARASACKIFAALMEGSDTKSVMDAIVDVLDTAVFRIVVKDVYTRCAQLMPKLGKDPDADLEYETLLSCGYDMMSVSMQLREEYDFIRKGIEPTPAEKEEKGGYFDGYHWINSQVLRLEFEWRETLDITYFAKVQQQSALTEASKLRVMSTVTIESPDAKKREFMNLGQELVDEMMWLFRLAKIYPFRKIQENYMLLRQMAFLLAIMLNVLLLVSVRGPGNGGGEGQYNIYDYDTIKIHPLAAQDAVYVLTLASMVCYALCLAYTLAARLPLVYSKRLREQEQLLRLWRKEVDNPKAKLPIGEWPLLKLFFGALTFYMVIGCIFLYKYNKPWYAAIGPEYWRFGTVVFVLWAIPLLNDFFDGSDHFVAYNYVSLFRAFTEKETLAIIVFQVFNCVGLFYFYFSTLLLLDFVTLSERLQNVAKAVVLPMADLVLVFTLMIFVAFIFAAYGMFFFGPYYVMPSDDYEIGGPRVRDPLFGPFDDDYNQGRFGVNGTAGWNSSFTVAHPDGISTCPNLAMCFFETLDVGMRTGDLVGNAMDSVWYDSGLTYADRVLYGIIFYFILGVILFDIVTGIIIDTFSSLRETTAERLKYMLNTAFISDIERAEYEENGPDFKFDKLDKEDQPKWNYVLFMAYLRQKDKDSYSGAESEIAKKIDAQDPSWFPSKRSWQLMKFMEDQGEDAGEVLDDRILEISKEVEEAKLNATNAAMSLGVKL